MWIFIWQETLGLPSMQHLYYGTTCSTNSRTNMRSMSMRINYKQETYWLSRVQHMPNKLTINCSAN
jgi:hypothetical protein